MQKKLWKKCGRVFVFIMLAIVFISMRSVFVEAETIECFREEDIPAQTAYIDMSCVGPLELHFTEDATIEQPDYYYATTAFDILKENTKSDPMYRNCKQVIVVIEKKYEPMDYVNAISKVEPKVQTGYLNLLSNEMSKYYTIDNVTIHIQRQDQFVY